MLAACSALDTLKDRHSLCSTVIQITRNHAQMVSKPAARYLKSCARRVSKKSGAATGLTIARLLLSITFAMFNPRSEAYDFKCLRRMTDGARLDDSPRFEHVLVCLMPESQELPIGVYEKL